MINNPPIIKDQVDIGADIINPTKINKIPVSKNDKNAFVLFILQFK
jgi:hypothetical protein